MKEIDDETELSQLAVKRLMGIAYETVAQLMQSNEIRSWHRGKRLVTCRREIKAYHEREAAKREQALRAMNQAPASKLTPEEEADAFFKSLAA